MAVHGIGRMITCRSSQAAFLVMLLAYSVAAFPVLPDLISHDRSRPPRRIIFIFRFVFILYSFLFLRLSRLSSCYLSVFLRSGVLQLLVIRLFIFYLLPSVVTSPDVYLF